MFSLKRIPVSDSGQLEKQLEDVTSARRDLEDSSKHIKSLEKQMKSLTQEKDDLQKVKTLVSAARLIFVSAFLTYLLMEGFSFKNIFTLSLHP